MQKLGWSLIALALIVIEVVVSTFVYFFSVMGAKSELQLILITLAMTALIPVLYFLCVYGVFSPEIGRKMDGVAAAIISFLVNSLMLVLMFKVLVYSEYNELSPFQKGSSIPSILGFGFVLFTQFVSIALLRYWTNHYPTK